MRALTIHDGPGAVAPLVRCPQHGTDGIECRRGEDGPAGACAPCAGESEARPLQVMLRAVGPGEVLLLARAGLLSLASETVEVAERTHPGPGRDRLVRFARGLMLAEDELDTSTQPAAAARA